MCWLYVFAVFFLGCGICMTGETEQGYDGEEEKCKQGCAENGQSVHNLLSVGVYTWEIMMHA